MTMNLYLRRSLQFVILYISTALILFASKYGSALDCYYCDDNTDVNCMDRGDPRHKITCPSDSVGCTKINLTRNLRGNEITLAKIGKDCLSKQEAECLNKLTEMSWDTVISNCDSRTLSVTPKYAESMDLCLQKNGGDAASSIFASGNRNSIRESRQQARSARNKYEREESTVDLKMKYCYCRGNLCNGASRTGERTTIVTITIIMFYFVP